MSVSSTGALGQDIGQTGPAGGLGGSGGAGSGVPALASPPLQRCGCGHTPRHIASSGQLGLGSTKHVRRGARDLAEVAGDSPSKTHWKTQLREAGEDNDGNKKAPGLELF